MLSRMPALFGSCSKRTSSTSTTSRLSLVSVTNSRSRSSIKTPSSTGSGPSTAFRRKRRQCVDEAFNFSCAIVLPAELNRPLTAEPSRVRHLLSGDHDRFALHRHCGLNTAGPREKPGIKRLNSMSVDALAAGLARQQRRDRGWNLRVHAGSSDLEANTVGRAKRFDADLAAARDSLSRNDKHVQEQFDQVLRQQCPWQVPSELGLVVLEKPPRDSLGIAEIDLGAGRTGCSERDPAELEFG